MQRPNSVDLTLYHCAMHVASDPLTPMLISTAAASVYRQIEVHSAVSELCWVTYGAENILHSNRTGDFTRFESNPRAGVFCLIRNPMRIKLWKEKVRCCQSRVAP